MNGTQKLNRRAAAIYISAKTGASIAYQTLANLAHAGKGPRYSRLFNRAIYQQSDLDEWIERRFEEGVVVSKPDRLEASISGQVASQPIIRINRWRT